jgi:hypothetical protein
MLRWMLCAALLLALPANALPAPCAGSAAPLLVACQARADAPVAPLGAGVLVYGTGDLGQAMACAALQGTQGPVPVCLAWARGAQGTCLLVLVGEGAPVSATCLA